MGGPKASTGSQNGGVFTPLQIMQRCDPSEPLQQWRWRNVTQTSGSKTVNGSVLYVVDPQSETGQAWCLTGWQAGPEPCNVSSGGQLAKGGTVRGWAFTPVVEHASGPAWNLSDGDSTRDTANIGYSNQPFSAGPVPHSRWLQKFEPEPPTNTVDAGPYVVDLKALASEAGGAIQSVDTTGIIDDDNAGSVKTGGKFCLALHSGATLEMWAGLLSPSASGLQRWAVALVNRSPSTDTIRLDFTKLPDLSLVGLAAADVVAETASFALQDVWLGVNHTDVAGAAGWKRAVDAHDTALLIVTKTKTDDIQSLTKSQRQHRRSWSPLAGLPPLPKPHHSWLSSDPTFADAEDPVTRDVVRITGSCPVYACFGDRGSCHAPSHPCSDDAAGRAAVEACVALAAPVNATIAVNYSPWYCAYRGTDPAARTKVALADTARELQLWSTNLGKIKSWLGGRVPVSTVLLDSEKFECGRPNPDGCSNETVWAALDEKHNMFFAATKAVFPRASVEMFGHGGARFRGISSGTFSTTSTKFSLRERSDTFSVSLYAPSELGYTRETYARSVAVARAHNISTVTPWIALGAGYDGDHAVGGQREFVNSLEYPLSNSWMLGRDINVPPPPAAESPDGADWAFARYAVLFPDINNPPCEGSAPAPVAFGGTANTSLANSFESCSKPIQDSTLALLHFTAFVLGANCIQELPNRTSATKQGFTWSHLKPGPMLGGCYLKSDDHVYAPRTFPAPRWWEQGGASIRGIWPKCALGDGLSSLGEMRGLPAFMALLDRLHASKVTTLQMVVYDSGEGYTPEDLWCGLAGSNYSKPMGNIGSEADWHTFIDAAHAKNMTVTSFWNAAYMWSGSPYFKQAEADIRAHGLDALPEASPARWFRWSSRRSRHVKPADRSPNSDWCGDWVWDPDVNMSYYSVWGCQPTTDYTSPQWRAEITRILTRWIVDLKLDGFMFDAPDGYIGAGNDGVAGLPYNPGLLREALSGVIRNVSDGRAAAFAEIYSDPPLMNGFGFDGEFADDKVCPQHSAKYCPPNTRSSAVGQGILSANASLIETGMTGPGSVDDLSAQVFRAPGVPSRTPYLKDLPVSVSWLPGTNISSDFASDSLNCSLHHGATYAPPDLPAPVPLDECFSHCRADPKCEAVRVDFFSVPQDWTAPKVGCGLRGGIDAAQCAVQAPVSKRSHTVPYTTFAQDAPDRSQMVVAITAIAGYLPIVRNSGNDWGMSAAPWPGDTGGALPGLLAAMQGESSLGLNSLRLRVTTGSEAHYAMLRWDALGTGRAALAVINLEQVLLPFEVEVDLSAMPPQLQGQRPTDLLCKTCPALPPLAHRIQVGVTGLSYKVLVGLQLPRWTPRGYLYNCSATYKPAPVGEMPLSQCLVSCLRDSSCDAVTVDWIEQHSWPNEKTFDDHWYGNQVRCHVRGGIDLTKCATDAKEAHSTITMVKTDDGASGLAAQLASSVQLSPQPGFSTPTPRPDARLLFYDILEHEQFNKQRKGFMYALTVARSLGRELVLHRLRVRKYDGARSRAQGVYSHGFFSWRRFFNMSQLATGEPPIHEFVRDNLFGSSPGLDQSG